MTDSFVDLSVYENADYDPGRGRWIRLLWYVTSVLLFETGWAPLSRCKTTILRAFGAQIGAGLVLKPNVRIKYPWKLRIGDHCWIGQETWIDNIADVSIGSHVCISQRAFICTGSHNYKDKAFGLQASPVVVGDGAWICAAALVLPGVRVGANAVVAGGSVVTSDVQPATIVGGNPARLVGQREVS